MADFSVLAVPGVQALRPYEPGKPVETLERELGIRQAVKLASNENPLGPSRRAVAAIQGALGNPHIYPDGNGFALKQALAARHGVAPAQITLGNGSNEILELVARAWLAPGRNAVFSRHAFAVYPLVVQAVSAEGRVADALLAGSAQPYGHDLEAMAALVDEGTRVVFIANPNNPTGTWVTADALDRFLTRIPAETLVVVDEAYAEYVEAPDYPDSTQWLHRFPNLLVTRTFSKIFGLAGLRLGYSVSSAAVAELLNRVRQPFNVNSLAQVAGLAALADAEHVAESVRVNRGGLFQVGTGLRERGLDFIPSVGNFLTFDVQQPGGPVYERLLRQGVIVRPVANYGLPTHLRVTIGTAAENERFLQALDSALKP
jgi:histidinol-phosphate aminotransferase